MKQFKIRCSQIGKIMTNPRSKSDLLSQTTKSYVEKVRKEELYSRREEIFSKYMDKGIFMEDEAIEFAGKILGWEGVKNEVLFDDTHLTGTPDVILEGMIVDIKCSWSCFTFPIFETQPNKDYWWQLQGYMALTGKERSQLVYCLMDMPEDLLERELARSKGMDSSEAEEIVRFHTYSNLPDKLRIRKFDIEYDPKAIESIRSRVEECREYYLELI